MFRSPQSRSPGLQSPSFHFLSDMKPKPLPQHFALPKTIQELVDDGFLHRSRILDIKDLTLPADPPHRGELPCFALYAVKPDGQTAIRLIREPYA